MGCARGEGEGRQGGASIRVVDQRSRVGEYISCDHVTLRGGQFVVCAIWNDALLSPKSGKMDRGNRATSTSATSNIYHCPQSIVVVYLES